MIRIGDQAPEFELPDTDGEPQACETPAAVIFTCNHCPYALAWHDRLSGRARLRDVRFFAINPNDSDRYPRDSFEAMKERVRATRAGRCRTCTTSKQEVARAFGAKTTPDVFVIDFGRRAPVPRRAGRRLPGREPERELAA